MKASRTALRRHYLGAEIVGQEDFIVATEAALAIYVATEAFGGGELALRLIRQRAFSGNKQSERNVDVDDDAWQRPVVEYAAYLAAADYRRARLDATPPSDRVDAEVWSTYFMLDMLLELNADDESMDRAFRLVVTDSLAYLNSRPPDPIVDADNSTDHAPPPTPRWKTFYTWLRRILGRRLAHWNGIAIVGATPFIRSTCAALELLKQTSHAEEIFANLGTVIHSASSSKNLACISVSHRRPKIYVYWDTSETSTTIAYAGVLAHEACHNILYRNDQELLDPDEERACYNFELKVLRELDAKEEQLSDLEFLQLMPLRDYPPDDYFFQQLDWRKWRARVTETDHADAPDDTPL